MAEHANSDSDDDFYSLEARGGAEASDSDSINNDMAPPVHPLPSFQSAFEESILEAAEDGDSPLPDPDAECDAEMRRRRLLEAERYEDVAATRWKRRPGAKYHPFVKLMAQIVFGMHLLQQEQAKSHGAVVKILQNHVNDVDNFLERTSDDFDLAIVDIEERTRYLQLPMQHMDIFEVMLDEKKFRTDLLSGNEKIEKIIGMSGKAMEDAMLDIDSGLKCTRELHEYLTAVEKMNTIGNKDIAEVFGAMRGNQQGWSRFLSDLQTKGDNLSKELVTLGNVIADISRLAGEASRRNKPQVLHSASVSQKSSNRTSALQSKYTEGDVVSRKSGPWLDKPLPKEPGTIGNAVEVVMPKPHPVPFATRFESPRQRAPTPGPRSTSGPMSRSPAPQRPQTSSSADPKTARYVAINDANIFRKHSNPLRSHPPDIAVPVLQPPPSRKPARTQSQGAGEVINTATKKVGTPLFNRSRSSGNIAVTMSPAAPVSRKTVGSGRQKGLTRINLVPKGRTDGGELPSISNGFSRHLSLKLKSTPPPRKSNHNPEQTTPQPVDPAYSSDRKRSTSSPTNFTTDTEKTEPDILPEPEKERPAVNPEAYSNKFSLARDDSQPGSRLALFPRVNTPTQPHSATPSPNSKAWEAALENPVKPPGHAIKASRTFSVAKFFHRKVESRSVSAS